MKHNSDLHQKYASTHPTFRMGNVAVTIMTREEINPLPPAHSFLTC